jgi:hypothetical protein
LGLKIEDWGGGLLAGSGEGKFEPFGGDVPRSPWPSQGVVEDLERLYRLRQGVSLEERVDVDQQGDIAALQTEGPGSRSLFQPPPLSILARKAEFLPSKLRFRAGNPGFDLRSSRFSTRNLRFTGGMSQSRTAA